MTSSLNGFSVSSLFGETLQEDVMGTTGTVHMVTPGYKPTEMDEIAQITPHQFHSFPSGTGFQDGHHSKQAAD